MSTPGRAAKLELPSDPAFVGAVLPPPDPERYRSFALGSRISVGRGYLRQVELLPGEELLLVVSDEEGSVRVYDRASSRLLANPRVPEAGSFYANGVVAWPEGPPRFVVASQAGLFVYDARTGALLAKNSDEKLDELRWSPDRNVLVARAAGAPDAAGRLSFFTRTAGGGGAPPRASLEKVGSLDFPERIDAWDLSADNRLLAMAWYP